MPRWLCYPYFQDNNGILAFVSIFRPGKIIRNIFIRLGKRHTVVFGKVGIDGCVLNEDFSGGKIIKINVIRWEKECLFQVVGTHVGI
jgi:hypothetical protein